MAEPGFTASLFSEVAGDSREERFASQALRSASAPGAPPLNRIGSDGFIVRS
jgi:hypothetical protein